MKRLSAAVTANSTTTRPLLVVAVVVAVVMVLARSGSRSQAVAVAVAVASTPRGRLALWGRATRARQGRDMQPLAVAVLAA